MLRFIGWLAGFVAAAVISLVLTLGIRWAVYLYRVIRGR